MACWKPNGDCSTPGNCGNTSGDCGCGGAEGGCSGGSDDSDRYPCSGIRLPDGDFTDAVVAVRNGCIVGIVSGTPAVYTPDDCCGDMPVGGGPVIVEGGPPGEDGQAATVTIAPIVQGSGSTWSVENVGTPTAAVFRFTAPKASAGGGAGGSDLGLTIESNGWKIEKGLVLKAALDSAVLEVIKKGQQGDKYVMMMGVAPDGSPQLLVNLDGIITDYTNQINDLNERVTAVEALLAGGGGTNPGAGTNVKALEQNPPLRNADNTVLGPNGTIMGPMGPVYEGKDIEGMPTLNPNNIPFPGQMRSDGSKYVGTTETGGATIEWGEGSTSYDTQTQSWVVRRGGTVTVGRGPIPDRFRPVN